MTTNNKGFIQYLILLIIVLITIIPFIGLPIKTGSGTQVGYVSAIEKSGLIWKTGTVYIKPTLESTQEDIYCVTDEYIYRELENKSISGEKIKAIHYSVLSAGIANCNGEGAIINRVEVVK